MDHVVTSLVLIWAIAFQVGAFRSAWRAARPGSTFWWTFLVAVLLCVSAVFVMPAWVADRLVRDLGLGRRLDQVDRKRAVADRPGGGS